MAGGVHQQRGLERGLATSPPRAPRLAIERMNTPGSRKWSVRRMRSPSRAPCVNGDDGSIDRTATARSRSPPGGQRTDQRRLADARGSGEPKDRRLAGVGEDLANEVPASGVVVLDERDRAGEGPAVAVEQASGEGGS